RPWRRGWWWLAAATAFVLGASIYLYLPLRRDAPMNYAREFGVDLRTWSGFWWMVSARMFASRMFAVPPGLWLHEGLTSAGRLWSNFLGFGCVLGVVGLSADFSRRRIVHAALLLMFAAHVAFVVTYNVSDKEVMLTPAYLIWDVWVGLGATALTG